MPVSQALLLKQFFFVETALTRPRKTTTQLGSQLCFGYLVLEIEHFNRLEKGILQKFKKKISDCRAFSFLRPFPAAGRKQYPCEVDV